MGVHVQAFRKGVVMVRTQEPINCADGANLYCAGTEMLTDTCIYRGKSRFENKEITWTILLCDS